MIDVVLGSLLAGTGFRVRGDDIFKKWTGRGLTTARIVCWAVPCGLLALMAGASLVVALMIGVAAWLGSIAGWWNSLTLGRNPKEGPLVEQWLRHTARGLLWTAPMVMVAIQAGGNGAWLALAGLLCGPAYELGWRTYPQRGTEIGEFVFGALIGAALMCSF